MKPCLFLRCHRDHRPGPFAVGPLAEHIDIAYQYDLADMDLGPYRALILSMLIDQQTLLERRAQLTAFLDGGGTVVLCGHVAFPVLDGLTPFVPLPRQGVEGLRVHRLAEHPVFDGVTSEDLTFRRGVAGFYGRGYNPPPAGAEVLNGLGPDRAPIDWVWRRPGGGQVFCHSGIDLWVFAVDPTSAARLTPQLIHWLTQDAEV